MICTITTPAARMPAITCEANAFDAPATKVSFDLMSLRALAPIMKAVTGRANITAPIRITAALVATLPNSGLSSSKVPMPTSTKVTTSMPIRSGQTITPTNATRRALLEVAMLTPQSSGDHHLGCFPLTSY